MIIQLDKKKIQVTDATKNIVEIAKENGISIMAPCFRDKYKHGCCKSCVIEVDGERKYACTTKAKDGMNIIYNRDDLSLLREERYKEYSNSKCSDNKIPLKTSCDCSNTSCCK